MMSTAKDPLAGAPQERQCSTSQFLATADHHHCQIPAVDHGCHFTGSNDTPGQHLLALAALRHLKHPAGQFWILSVIRAFIFEMSGSCLAGSIRLSPAYVVYQDGLDRMLKIYQPETFSLIVNGSEFKSTVAEVALLSSRVQLFRNKPE
jgi:hypothetical protein